MVQRCQNIKSSLSEGENRQPEELILRSGEGSGTGEETKSGKTHLPDTKDCTEKEEVGTRGESGTSSVGLVA